MAKGKQKGNKAKRDKMKTSNPRGDKRGGRKIKKKKENNTIDWVMWLHIKYHHRKGVKKICNAKSCNLRGRIMNSNFIPVIIKN